MKHLSRREFVKFSAAAGVVAASSSPGASIARAADASSPSSPAASARPPVHLFSKHAQWLDFEELGKFARDLGLDGIDLTVRRGGHVAPADAERVLPGAVEKIKRAGVEVVMMTTDIRSVDDPHARAVLRAAAASGIKFYRMGYYEYDTAKGIIGSLDAIRPICARLAELNAELGLHGAWQNHDGVRPGASIWDMWYVIKDLDPRWLGVQFDCRHATAEGGKSWVNDFALVQRFVRTTIVKDFRWTKNEQGRWATQHVPLGEGMVDFAQFFELYQKFGLAGPISLHLEYPLFDRDEKSMSKSEKMSAAGRAIAHDLALLRAQLKKSGLA